MLPKLSPFYPSSSDLNPVLPKLYPNLYTFQPTSPPFPRIQPTLPPYFTPIYPYFTQFLQNFSDGQSYITLLISIWDRRWSNTNVEEDIKYVSYYVLDSQSNQFNKEIISKRTTDPISGPTSGVTSSDRK